MDMYTYKTSIGNICIVESDGFITEINIDDSVKNTKETLLIKKTIKEINEYLEGRRKTFDIPLEPQGSEYFKKVWSELEKIPYGETRSYKEVAKNIGNEKAARAVGLANHNNPIPIIIPCHRVIGKNNKLVGYALGLDLKQKLLDLESKNV